MAVMLVEVFVRIERSHAAGSGGGDGLTIHVIGHVASGEYTGNAGGGGGAVSAALDDDVAVTHVELAAKMPVLGVCPIAMNAPVTSMFSMVPPCSVGLMRTPFTPDWSPTISSMV